VLKPRARKPFSSISGKSVMAFLFGLGSITQIRIIGAMGITEAACIVMAPLLLPPMWRKLRAVHGDRLLAGLALWFLSAVITDFYRQTSQNDALRGIFALPFLFAVFIVAFALLWDDLSRVRWMVLGLALSSLISVFVFQPAALIGRAEAYRVDVTAIADFKTVYASVLLWASLAVAALCYRKWPRITALILFAAGGYSLLEGSRSIFIVLFVSGIGAWIAARHFSVLRAAQRRLAVMVISLSILAVVATEIYAYSVERGWLGKGERDKYEMQSDTDLGLLSGRGGFFAAALVIKDSPILGLGSWAIDRNNYNWQFMQMIGDRDGVKGLRYQGEELFAPAHSHLMQAWVWHGFLGGAFWIYVLVLIFRYFRHAIHLCRPLIAFDLLLMIGALWDLLFSPFSNRPRWGILFAVLVLTLGEASRRERQKLAGEAIDVEMPWDGLWARKRLPGAGVQKSAKARGGRT